MKHMHAAEEKKVTVFTCETCGRQLHTKTAFQVKEKHDIISS